MLSGIDAKTKVQRPRLGEILVGLEVLTRARLEEAIARHEKAGGRFGDSLVRMKFLSKENLSRAVSTQRALRRATLVGALPTIVLRKIPATVAAELQVVPLAFVDKGRALAIATVNPADDRLHEQVRQIVGMPVLPCGATAESIRETVLRLYNLDRADQVAEETPRPPLDSTGDTLVRRNHGGASVYAELFDVSEAPPRVEPASDAFDDGSIDVDMDDDEPVDAELSENDNPFDKDASERTYRRIGEILISDGILDPLGLQRAMDQRSKWGGRLCSALVDLNLISAEELANVLAREIGAPVIRLLEYEPEPAALQLLSPELCRKLRLFPLAVGPDAQGVEVLVVATADPTDAAAFDEVQEASGRPVRIVVAREDEIEGAVRKHYGQGGMMAPLELAGPSSLDPFAPQSSPMPKATSPVDLDSDGLPSFASLVAALDRALAGDDNASAEENDPIGSGLLTPIDEQARSTPDGSPPQSVKTTDPTMRRKLNVPR